jgi:hypothetical protein
LVKGIKLFKQWYYGIIVVNKGVNTIFMEGIKQLEAVLQTLKCGDITTITGRTHQLSIHCQAIGHPLLGC